MKDHVRPFEVASRGLTLTEITGNVDALSLAAIHLGGELLDRFLAHDRRGIGVCKTGDVIDQQYDQAWLLYRQAHPNATQAEFQASGWRPTLDDTECDPELGIRNFAVTRSGGKFVGLWYLYNLVRVPSPPGSVVEDGYMAPGLRIKDRQREWEDDFVALAGAFLRRTLELEDRRSYRFRDWVFPTQQWGHRWNRGLATRVLPRVKAGDYTQEDRNVDGVSTPRRIFKA